MARFAGEIVIDPFDPHLTRAQIDEITGTIDGWIHDFAHQRGGTLKHQPPTVVRVIAKHLAAIMYEAQLVIGEAL